MDNITDDQLRLLYSLVDDPSTVDDLKRIEDFDALEIVKVLVNEKLIHYHAPEALFLITFRGKAILRDRGITKQRIGNLKFRPAI